MESKFPLGQIVATPAALEVCSQELIRKCIHRHASGDWGNVDGEDVETNNAALKHGSRLLSAYSIDETKPPLSHGDNCVWVITEADRSVTTVLLPSDY